MRMPILMTTSVLVLTTEGVRVGLTVYENGDGGGASLIFEVETQTQCCP